MLPRPTTDTPSPSSSSTSLPYSHFAAQMDKLSISSSSPEPREPQPTSSRVSPAISPTNPAVKVHRRKPSEISTSTSSSSSSSATPLPPPNAPSATVHPDFRREIVDFELGDTLGEGSYSTVVAARDKHTDMWYAIKIEEKRHIIKEKKIKYVEIEKNTLTRMTHPGIVRLYWTFQDKESLYFVLDLARNGELLKYIKKLGAFDLPTTQFYAAEILSAVEHVHSKGVIHRDVKPENILLDENMHIKLTDFGSAKILENLDNSGQGGSKANSFVGTAEYVSPELLTDKSACKASDFWALGCIIYQLLAGRPPFKGANEYQTFQKIIKLEFTFPKGFPDVARDLVSRLLVLDPLVRLGAPEVGGINTLKSHPFFNGIDWAGLFDSPAPRLHPYLPKLDKHNDIDLRSESEVFQRKSFLKDPFTGEPEDTGGMLKDESRTKKIEEQASLPWAPVLLENELILRVENVHKRRGLFSKKLVLILTDRPRLIYLDQEKLVLKGEISWTNKMVPELKGRKHFFVHTPHKTYYFEDPTGNAQEWVDEINRVLLDLYGPAG